jgi:uncharacterized protein (DUF2345 family)
MRLSHQHNAQQQHEQVRRRHRQSTSNPAVHRPRHPTSASAGQPGGGCVSEAASGTVALIARAGIHQAAGDSAH